MDYWADFYRKAKRDSKYFINRVRVRGVERLPVGGEQVKIQVYCEANCVGGEYTGRVFDNATFLNVRTDEKMIALEKKVAREDYTVFIHVTSVSGELPQRSIPKRS